MNMRRTGLLSINDEKTRRLIEGLTGDVTLKSDILEKMRGTGVIKKVSQGGAGGCVSHPEEFETRGMSQESKKGFEKIMSSGQAYYVPREKIVALKKASDKCKYQIEKLSVDGKNFIPLEALDEVEIEYDKAKDLWDKALAEIEESYDEDVASFKTTIWNTLLEIDEFNEDKKLNLFNQYIKGIPSKKEFAASQFFILKTEVLPTLTPVDGFSSDLNLDIAESVEDEYVRRAYSSIEAVFNDIVKSCNSILNQYGAYLRNGDEKAKAITGSTIKALSQLTQKLKTRNVFKNPVIENIGRQLEKGLTMNDADLNSIIEEVEIEISDYCEEVGLHLKHKPLISG